MDKPGDCQHIEVWFDWQPCIWDGVMHEYCTGCGKCLDICELQNA